MRRAPAAGYAMLAALVVMVLAATFALVVVGAVSGLALVERSDAAAWRADALAARALGAASSALRWRPGETSGSVLGGTGGDGDHWEASWTVAPPVAGATWPRRRVTVAAATGTARRANAATVELRAELWAMGLVCAGDADVRGPLMISGSGAYVGGSLSGREFVGFAPSDPAAAESPPADLVHGDAFPEAGVHAASVVAHGAEIHADGPSAAFPFDTDGHVGVATDPTWLEGPGVPFLLAAAAAAFAPDEALTGARLDLAALAPPPGGAPAGGRCLVLPSADIMTVCGEAPPAAGRLLVVVPGDAVLGDPDAPTRLSGALVVRGHLSVRGDVTLEGSLYAKSLTVVAPMRVVVAADWRERPLTGACRPVVVEQGR
jgi:hypothetical protein